MKTRVTFELRVTPRYFQRRKHKVRIGVSRWEISSTRWEISSPAAQVHLFSVKGETIGRKAILQPMNHPATFSSLARFVLPIST